MPKLYPIGYNFINLDFSIFYIIFVKTFVIFIVWD